MLAKEILKQSNDVEISAQREIEIDQELPAHVTFFIPSSPSPTPYPEYAQF